MSIPGISTPACDRRNRLAALRGFETAPVKFGGGGVGRLVLPEGSEMVFSEGEVPGRGDMEAALEQVNALLPGDVEPLSAGDIYWHPVEAASGRFISDRYAFLSTGTLRNIAAGGARGVAFMNSHRTGGFSTESELPLGKTAAGRFEQWLLPSGEVFERAMLGVYLLRGVAPMGANGPDSDTIDRMIRGGVLADVSVGLAPGSSGWVRCDVCGQDYSRSNCPHYAGTTRQMEPEHVEAQRRRGVPTGRASYTLMDWEIGEVSGVYDGAVPGAGFSKGYAMLAAGRMPERTAAEFAEAFGHLLKR